MAKQESIIESMIQKKGLNAPRVEPQDLDDALDPGTHPQYVVFPETTVTVCLLTLRNGYTVVGKSACASASNFDEEVGRKVAFKDARNQLWPLLGFALKDRLAQSAAA